MKKPVIPVPRPPVTTRDWIDEERFEQLMTQAVLLFDGLPPRVPLHALIGLGIVPLTYVTTDDIARSIGARAVDSAVVVTPSMVEYFQKCIREDGDFRRAMHNVVNSALKKMVRHLEEQEHAKK